MERSEDLKQARDLHLIRDERDREVEAEAGLRAGRAVVLVSQLLAAACLLQRDPAWLALLSLTFVWGAVKGFRRFAQDRERLYLAWGLLTAAGAAVLLGAYFQRAWTAGMSLSRLIGYAVLCRVLIARWRAWCSWRCCWASSGWPTRSATWRGSSGSGTSSPSPPPACCCGWVP